MAKRFCVSELAADATRCSGSVSTVIAASAIAALPAARPRDSSSGVLPIVGTSGVPKGGWIIATGNAIIAAGREHA
jgi:hypothetical protein